MNSKMKGFIGMIALFSFLFSVTTVCAQTRRVKASGTYKTKEVKIKDFDKIKLLGSPTVIYTQSANNKSTLKIYGSDNVIDLVDCTVTDGVLSISFKNRTSIEFGKQGRLKIMASSPMLKDVHLQGSGDVVLDSKLECDNLSLTLQGSGDITAGEVVCANDLAVTLQGSGDISIKNSVKAGNAALNLIGSGDIDIYNMTAKSAAATLQGSGDLKVKGAVQQAVLMLRNSGDLDAKDLKAVDVDATVNGSGDISCYVSGTLKCDISGSGDVGYKGNPVNVHSTGRNKPHKL